MSAKSRRNSPPRNAKRRRPAPNPAPSANNAARIDAALESLIELATNEIKKEVESKPTPQQLQRQQELDDLAEESLLESMQMMRMAQQRIIKRMQEDPTYIPTSRELAISKEISKLALFQLRQREKRLARQERADREAAKILKQVEKETAEVVREVERPERRVPEAALGEARPERRGSEAGLGGARTPSSAPEASQDVSDSAPTSQPDWVAPSALRDGGRRGT